MPLNENAKLSDVISALSDTQGINQKAELASVIGSPATASDNVATQITKLQTAKDTLATNITSKGVTASQTDAVSVLADKVGQIVIGKRWASGTFSSGSTSLVVSNLNFTPSIVIVRGFYSAADMAMQRVYVNPSLLTTYGTDKLNTVGFTSIRNNPTNISSLSVSFTITNGGFTVNNQSDYGGSWIAYE